MRLFPLILTLALPLPAWAETALSYGPRPAYLVGQMADSPLKTRLAACLGQPARASAFSIGHRGAPLMFPEHSREGYIAAATMGAGVLECDVTFTRDKHLVCRHAQNDLHSSTDILTSSLAPSCTRPFTPASGDTRAQAECRTSALTLAQFRTLRAKMDGTNPAATTPSEFQQGTAPHQTDLYSPGTLMTHAESIALFAGLGVQFTPELKAPVEPMPFDGMTQADYAQKLIDDYKAAGIPPEQVWPQSFNLDDVLYWIRAEPDFGRQAVWLDGRYRDRSFSPDDPATFRPSMAELKAMGVNVIAPPMWMLLTLENGRIIPSAYAIAARQAGLDIFAWTIERSGPLSSGGGWYYRSITPAITGDGMIFPVLDVLARDVGVKGVFSDWPATTSFYATCLGID